MTNNAQVDEGKEIDFATQNAEVLLQIVQQQTDLLQKLNNLNVQNSFLLQQTSHVLQATSQQSEIVQNSEKKLYQELKRFQTGSTQRAMSAIFYKLFRDVLKILNQIDVLAQSNDESEYSERELAWIKAIQMLQGQFENFLMEWGCTLIDIKTYKTEFDPEFHEATLSGAEGVSITDIEAKPLPENIIIHVQQRGWQMQDTILQYPIVVVS
jgi:molecular chaperone GrpE (heat shock protein)